MGRRLLQNVKYLMEALIDIIFSPSLGCPNCGKIIQDYNRYRLCRDCEALLKPYDAENGIFCIDGVNYVDAVYSSFHYEGISRDMILSLKYKDKYEIAGVMAEYIGDLIKEKIVPDVIIPVPVSLKREAVRGYNQAELIGLELSRKFGIPLKKYLKRNKSTRPQVLFNGMERWYNVEDAFEAKGGLKEKNILLIDDVITTGATVYYCAKALKIAGAKNVYAASFARTTK